MNKEWTTSQVSLKYMFSYITLFEYKCTLKVLPLKIISDCIVPASIALPEEKLSENEKGYLLRSVPLPNNQPTYSAKDNYIYYVASQFNRYYVDLRQTFDEYSEKFSSKTKSTIRRKIRRFSSSCNGNDRWKVYRTADELSEFYRDARKVSSKSYQEKLLQSGLPDTTEFYEEMIDLASRDQARGYLLFDGKEPVAYMYCPIQDGVLLYEYLGYLPSYSKWSVGTILHWYAFESIFSEAKFKYFDFTEGESDHKRLYSTGSMLCGNVYIFPKSVSARLLVKSHRAVSSLSLQLGKLLERLKLKTKIKRLMKRQGNS